PEVPRDETEAEDNASDESENSDVQEEKKPPKGSEDRDKNINVSKSIAPTYNKGYRIIIPSRLQQNKFPFFAGPDVFSKYTPPPPGGSHERQFDPNESVDRYSLYDPYPARLPFRDLFSRKMGISEASLERLNREDEELDASEYRPKVAEAVKTGEAGIAPAPSHPPEDAQSIPLADHDGTNQRDTEDEEVKPRAQRQSRTPRPKNKVTKEIDTSSLRRSQRPVKRNRRYLGSLSDDEEFQLETPIVVRLSEQPSSAKSVTRKLSKTPENRPTKRKAILEEKGTGHAEERMKLAQTRTRIVDHLRTDLQNFAQYLEDGARDNDDLYLEWLRNVKDAIESGSYSRETILKNGQRELIMKILLGLRNDEGELALAFVGAFSSLQPSKVG
ncbi:hypothetical protein CVT26_003973, partial [Gymnopilus dilepis]